MNSGGIDANLLVVIALVCTVMLAVFGVLAFVLVRATGQSRYRRRVAAIAGAGGRADKDDKAGATASRRRAVQQRLKEMEDQRKRSKRGSTLRGDLQQAGLRSTTRNFFLISAGVGIVCAAIYLYFELPPLGAITVFFVGFLGLPRMFVKKLGKRRRNKFTHHFADAVDVIVRGIQSGLPVNECLNIIARESPEPVCLEFRQVVEGIKVGLTMNETLQRSLERIPTVELKFFAVVLAIQQQTGGNLAETLGNLSGVLRDRKRMSDKIQAMTAEARMTAMIIGSLPFCMTAILALVSPDYIGLLFEDRTGHFLIGGGISSMLLGVFIMNHMIAFEY
ncbi:MAG: type II secretion system F family protein [Alphaproteobacteria bacterium]|nr:type II secretion system F family protein [Alphaproteobacteria bacterium]